MACAAAAGLLLSACSNGGSSLAQQACVHVAASIRLYEEAIHASTLAVARQEARRALGELSAALPLAARATSDDPDYNGLMTTLERSGQTSEANLIPALRAQCAATNSPTSQQELQPPPSTSPLPAPSGAG